MRAMFIREALEFNRHEDPKTTIKSWGLDERIRKELNNDSEYENYLEYPTRFLFLTTAFSRGGLQDPTLFRDFLEIKGSQIKIPDLMEALGNLSSSIGFSKENPKKQMDNFYTLWNWIEKNRPEYLKNKHEHVFMVSSIFEILFRMGERVFSIHNQEQRDLREEGYRFLWDKLVNSGYISLPENKEEVQNLLKKYSRADYPVHYSRILIDLSKEISFLFDNSEIIKNLFTSQVDDDKRMKILKNLAKEGVSFKSPKYLKWALKTKNLNLAKFLLNNGAKISQDIKNWASQWENTKKLLAKVEAAS